MFESIWGQLQVVLFHKKKSLGAAGELSWIERGADNTKVAGSISA